MEEIKRCPFCGNEATLVKSFTEDGNAYYFVECDDCGARGESYTAKEYAIKNWNKRFDDSAWHNIICNPKDFPDNMRLVELKLQRTYSDFVLYGHGFLSHYDDNTNGYWHDAHIGWLMHPSYTKDKDTKVIAWREV